MRTSEPVRSLRFRTVQEQTNQTDKNDGYILMCRFKNKLIRKRIEMVENVLTSQAVAAEKAGVICRGNKIK